MRPADLAPIKQISILEVAKRLGLEVRGKKAMCFGGHDKRTASLSLAPAKGIWKCFGCGKGGDGIALVMAVLHCDFGSALGWFATQYGVDVGQVQTRGGARKRRSAHTLSRSTLKAETGQPKGERDFGADAALYGWLVSQCGEVSEARGLEYLRDHGIPLEVANRFGVRELRDPRRAWLGLTARWGTARVYSSGLAWGERDAPECLIWTSYAILFPFQCEGEVGYIQGRLFRGQPKYLNPRGVSKPLYNAGCLRGLFAGSVIHVCEGVPDVLALEARGVTAVGVLGASSFRAEWVDLFLGLNVVLLPDGDSGGDTFRTHVSDIFAARGKSVRVVRLPPGKDVAEVIADMGKKP